MNFKENYQRYLNYDKNLFSTGSNKYKKPNFN